MTPKKVRATLLPIALLSLHLGEAGAQAQSRVQVHVMDAFGTPLPARSIKIVGPRSTTEALGDNPINLEYGQYTVEVTVPGFAPARMSALIDQPAQILAVAMTLGKMEADVPPCAILGHMAPEAKAVRIRAVQLFGSYVTDVPVGPGELFEIRGLACGDYLLIAMGAGKFLGTMATRASTLPARIEMKENPGKPGTDRMRRLAALNRDKL